MSGIQIPPGWVEGFQMQAANQTPERVDLVCSGALEAPDLVSQLQPELLKLHGELLAAKLRLVRLEMQRMEYMNSSGLKSFMVWFLKAEQNPGNYRIELAFDPTVTWQQLSFTAMARMVPKVVKLVPVGAAGA